MHVHAALTPGGRPSVSARTARSRRSSHTDAGGWRLLPGVPAGGWRRPAPDRRRVGASPASCCCLQHVLSATDWRAPRRRPPGRAAARPRTPARAPPAAAPAPPPPALPLPPGLPRRLPRPRPAPSTSSRDGRLLQREAGGTTVLYSEDDTHRSSSRDDFVLD